MVLTTDPLTESVVKLDTTDILVFLFDEKNILLSKKEVNIFIRSAIYKEKIGVTFLAKEINMPNSTMMRALRKLEGFGFIRRVYGLSDRRSCFIEITREGATIFNEIEIKFGGIERLRMIL